MNLLIRIVCLLTLLAGFAFSQNPVQRTKTYAGAPTGGDCTSVVAGVLVAIDTSTSPDTLHDCVETGGSPQWVARGTGSGSVTSVDATGGVQTSSGSAITTTGTVRGAWVANAQTGTTYTVLTGDR